MTLSKREQQAWHAEFDKGDFADLSFSNGYKTGAKDQAYININQMQPICCKICRDAYSACGNEVPCKSCNRELEIRKTILESITD